MLERRVESMSVIALATPESSVFHKVQKASYLFPSPLFTKSHPSPAPKHFLAPCPVL